MIFPRKIRCKHYAGRRAWRRALPWGCLIICRRRRHVTQKAHPPRMTCLATILSGGPRNCPSSRSRILSEAWAPGSVVVLPVTAFPVSALALNAVPARLSAVPVWSAAALTPGRLQREDSISRSATAFREQRHRTLHSNPSKRALLRILWCREAGALA